MITQELGSYIDPFVTRKVQCKGTNKISKHKYVMQKYIDEPTLD